MKDKQLEERVRALYDQGYPDNEIGPMVGVSNKSIGYWRRSKGLPTVFLDRKRLTVWEKGAIFRFIGRENTWHHYQAQTLQRHEKGLTLFVMSLKKPLASLTNLDVEDYVISHNREEIDLSRREELLRTEEARRFKVPEIPTKLLYEFGSCIMAPRIFNRDKACVVCRKGGALNLHHLKGKFNLLPENLQTLCSRCHIILRHAALSQRPRYEGDPPEGLVL